MTTPQAQPPPPARGGSRITVFGRRAVLEALRCPNVDVQAVLSVSHHPAEFRRVLQRACREAGVQSQVATRADVNALSREPRHDQGVVASVGLLRLTEVSSYLEQTRGRGARVPHRLLAFDGITNSQNIGMMVRSAVAAGMDGVVWPLSGVPWINGLVVKASASAIYDCPILRCETLVDGLAELRAGGFEIAGLAASGGRNLFEFAPPHRIAYVVGGETLGLSEMTRELVDHPLTIPLEAGVESLNVAVAASLVCFQARYGAR